MNDAMLLTDRIALPEDTAASLNPLALEGRARQNKRSFDLRYIHSFVEDALGRQDLNFAPLEGIEDARHASSVPRFLRRELMKEKPTLAQQIINFVKLAWRLIRGIDEVVANFLARNGVDQVRQSCLQGVPKGTKRFDQRRGPRGGVVVRNLIGRCGMVRSLCTAPASGRLECPPCCCSSRRPPQSGSGTVSRSETA